MASETHHLFPKPITCHAFNRDRSQVAVCPNDETIEIYSKQGSKYVLSTTLKEHGQRVNGIDWAPNSNRIVSCGQDRNAYVWELKDNVWKPTLVILRINRAATHVKWSPKEDKFAVATGARLISVCYFEQENDWWVSKHIKKPIRSTVLSLDWHPNNVLLAAGSADFKARVFSGYIKGLDEKPSATAWGKKMTFGECMAEFANGGGGWVHGVSFSPDGNKLAWIGHDSSFSVVDMNKDKDVCTIKFSQLPLTACTFVTANSVVAAGHDCTPVLYSGDDNNKWTYVDKLDHSKKKAAGGNSAMNKFRQMDSRGQESDSGSTTLDTVHQNAITEISIHTGDKSNVSKFATSGVDGRLVIWDCKSLESSISGLKIK